MKKLLSLFGKWIVARIKDPKTYVALFVVSGFCDATIKEGFIIKAAHAQTDIIWLQPSGSTTFNQTVFSTATKWKSETLAASPASGLVLTTDGTNSSWGSQFSLPSQTGNSGKPLVTNGTSPSWGKRQESYSGTTSSAAAPALGLVTFTYSTTYAVPPVVTPAFISTNPRENIQMETNTTTGCTFRIILRTEVLGLLPTYAGVGGRQVDILVTEK